MTKTAACLALDTSSPLVSVAISTPHQILATRSIPQRQSSPVLLKLVQECLDEAGFGLTDLDGAVALRGPGSFTGLRVGLATLLGIHQALGLPATALPTLEILARAADPGEGRILAAVDALRNEFFTQLFERRDSFVSPINEPRRIPASEIPDMAPCTCVGFGAVGIGQAAENADTESQKVKIRYQEPGPLAPVAARLAASGGVEWDSSLLTSPLYLRGAPVTLPKKPKSVMPSS